MCMSAPLGDRQASNDCNGCRPRLPLQFVTEQADVATAGVKELVVRTFCFAVTNQCGHASFDADAAACTASASCLLWHAATNALKCLAHWLLCVQEQLSLLTPHLGRS